MYACVCGRTETPPTKEEPKSESSTDSGDVEKAEGEEQEMGGGEEEAVNGERAVGDIIMEDQEAVEA